MRVVKARLLVAAVLLAAQAQAVTGAESETMRQAVDAVCPLLEQQAALRLEIRAELANPTRIVHLRRLYELGRLLQVAWSQLQTETTEQAEGLRLFEAWASRPLDLGFCISWRELREAQES